MVASIVCAYPNKCPNVALALFSNLELFLKDRLRLNMGESNLQPIALHTNEIYRKERNEAKDMKHRKTSLELICFNYQLSSVKRWNEDESRHF